jgi:hypothetical protein
MCLAARYRIVMNGRCTAERGSLAFAAVVLNSAVNLFKSLCSLSKWTFGDFVWMNLVIADEDDLTVIAGKRRHAILETGDQQAVIHFLARLGDYRIAKSIWQIDDAIRIGLERSEA